MASVAGTAVRISALSRSVRHEQPMAAVSSLRPVSFSSQRRSFPSVRYQPVRFRVSSAAKKETVDKVCEIVKKQLALSEDASVTGESKFSVLGADSLDTVEIVMGLEEAFGICVEEESAQTIATVQDAADLIDKLVATKGA